MRVYNKRTSDVVQGSPKLPTAQQLSYGELFVNYANGYETLAIKNSSNDIVPFDLRQKVIGDISDYWKNVEDSAITYDNIIDMLNFNMVMLKNYIDNNFAKKPVTIWETDGTTGLYGENRGSLEITTWQLENLDFTPYHHVIAYIKQADLPITGQDNLYITPSVAVVIPLDDASKSNKYDAYIGGGGGTNMNDRDIHFQVLCGIDSTKTKFKVISEHSIAGTLLGERNTNGRYCYKIVGYYE